MMRNLTKWGPLIAGLAVLTWLGYQMAWVVFGGSGFPTRIEGVDAMQSTWWLSQVLELGFAAMIATMLLCTAAIIDAIQDRKP